MSQSVKSILFRRWATELFPHDDELVASVVSRALRFDGLLGKVLQEAHSANPQEEEAWWKSTMTGMVRDAVSLDAPIDQGAWRPAPEASWTQLRSQLQQYLPAQPVPDSPAVLAESELERLRTIHNERVKLLAAFCNNLSVWFLGAGAVGTLFNTFQANGLHPSVAALQIGGVGVSILAIEIGGIGVAMALVLRWAAYRIIGNLR